MPEQGLKFFTLEEAVAVETLAERIFPETDDGPGAAEAGVTAFIDRELAGGWGQGDRMYRSAPFATPAHQGHAWQLPLTPAEVYRVSLAALEQHSAARYGKPVGELESGEADELLADLSGGAVPAFEQFPGTVFFIMLLENVKEGLFADPSYGGNQGFIGWKWIGFPGDPDRYGEPYSKQFGDLSPYQVEPRGLLPG